MLLPFVLFKSPSHARARKVMTGAVFSSARSGDRGEEFSRRPRLADDDDDDDDETRKCASVSQTYPSSVGVFNTSAAAAALSWLLYTGQTRISYSNISETATKTK